MSFIPGMRPVPFAVSGVTPTVAYLGKNISNSDLTTYTLSGVALGDDSKDRLVVINVHTIDNASNSVSSSCTIAGVSATTINGTGSGGGVDVVGSQIYAAIPAGTVGGSTGPVVVVFTAGAFRCHIATHVIYGLTSNTPDETHTNSGNPLTLTTTPPAGSVVVGASTTFFASNPTLTWANITESYDDAGEGATERYSGGAAADLAATSTTFSATATSASVQAGVISIWR